MSHLSRQLAAASPGSGGRGDPRTAVLLATLAGLGSACARFGFERIDPARDGGFGGGWVVVGAGAGGARDGADASVPGMLDGGWAGQGGAAGQGGRDAGTSSGDAGSSGGGGAGLDSGAAADCSDGVLGGAGADCAGPGCPPCVCSFDAPERLGDPNYAGNDLWSPRLSSDGVSLYFAFRTQGFGEQIAVTTRPDRGAAFGLGQPLPPPVNEGNEGTPYVSSDGLSLYFYSGRAGSLGGRDLYVATRRDEADTFEDVTPLSDLNTAELDYLPWLSRDERTLYFASGPAGDGDIFRARRRAGGGFAPAEPLSELNTPSDEGGITLSADGLEAILASNRPGGSGARDLYRAWRAGSSEPFSTPEPLVALNTPDNDIDPALSPDGRELYFASDRGGQNSELYRALRRCRR